MNQEELLSPITSVSFTRTVSLDNGRKRVLKHSEKPSSPLNIKASASSKNIYRNQHASSFRSTNSLLNMGKADNTYKNKYNKEFGNTNYQCSSHNLLENGKENEEPDEIALNGRNTLETSQMMEITHSSPGKTANVERKVATNDSKIINKSALDKNQPNKDTPENSNRKTSSSTCVHKVNSSTSSSKSRLTALPQNIFWFIDDKKPKKFVYPPNLPSSIQLNSIVLKYKSNNSQGVFLGKLIETLDSSLAKNLWIDRFDPGSCLNVHRDLQINYPDHHSGPPHSTSNNVILPTFFMESDFMIHDYQSTCHSSFFHILSSCLMSLDERLLNPLHYFLNTVNSHLICYQPNEIVKMIPILPFTWEWSENQVSLESKFGFLSISTKRKLTLHSWNEEDLPSLIGIWFDQSQVDESKLYCLLWTFFKSKCIQRMERDNFLCFSLNHQHINGHVFYEMKLMEKEDPFNLWIAENVNGNGKSVFVEMKKDKGYYQALSNWSTSKIQSPTDYEENSAEAYEKEEVDGDEKPKNTSMHGKDSKEALHQCAVDQKSKIEEYGDEDEKEYLNMIYLLGYKMKQIQLHRNHRVPFKESKFYQVHKCTQTDLID